MTPKMLLDLLFVAAKRPNGRGKSADSVARFRLYVAKVPAL